VVGPVFFRSYSWTWDHWVPRMDHRFVFLGAVTQDKKMSKGHLPRVVYRQVYNVYED